MTKKRALVAIPLAVLIALVALALVLGGRNTGLQDAKGSGDTSAGSLAEGPAPDPAPDTTSDKVTATSRQASSVEPLSRAVISTGQVTLHTQQMARARAEILRLVASWGGSVADEQSTSDDKGRLVDSTMTLRVPSNRFEDAMAAFDTIGDVEQRSQKSQDVTTKVIDNDARVRAGERSIRQIEALLSRAEKLGDIIAIENDLARRQADLDSLKSQQAWLQDQTSMSTVNVYLSPPMVRHHQTQDAKGFLAGLENGWDALGGATVVALTVLGAVLPFAVLIGVLAVPAWLVVRRRWLSAASAPARSA